MRKLVTLLIFSLVSISANAAIQTEEVKYQVNGKEFTGYMAYDSSIKGKRPGILVMHEWWGHDDYVRERAKMFAKLGYTAFALDMYGSGVLADHPDNAKAFMNAIFSDMDNTRKRFNKALEILRQHKTVNPDKVASIGYCMGGGLGLAMARAGADLDGVIVVHGSLGTKTPAKPGDIKARILVLTGAEDPFVPPEQVAAFKKEMEAAKVDYKLISYKGAKHSFSVEGADAKGKKFNMPLAYNKKADKDSWKQIKKFLKKTF
ncbi:MAG: dienelactone hydrolase family protein [Thioalkalispiraceae bacterium]|jgi:dienelactone hydrolase